MPDAENPASSASISSGNGWNEIAESLRRVTVEILGRDGRRGSGVIWTRDGLIVTNAHVAAGDAFVRLHGNRTMPTKLLGRYPRGDLAALRAAWIGLPCAERRDSRTLRPGELVIAVGHPGGALGAISMGIVHAASGDHWVEADIRLAPGNSGGPLADAAGRLVGINTMVMNGMGLAVSTRAIELFLSRILPAREGAA